MPTAQINENQASLLKKLNQLMALGHGHLTIHVQNKKIYRIEVSVSKIIAPEVENQFEGLDVEMLGD